MADRMTRKSLRAIGINGGQEMLNTRLVSWSLGLFGAVTFVVCDLRDGNATESAHAYVSRTAVAGVHVADLVGLTARARRELSIWRLCRLGVLPDLQLA